MSESDPTAQLSAGVGTPIAELNPELQDTQKRVIRGEITVFWPYSPLRDVVAFVLAEPDFRLRRDKGTVRVEFTGASAKAVVDLGLGGGDEVALSLDGVAWAERDTRMPVVGTPLEWQLRFSNRLLAQITLVADEETKLLNIDQAPGEALQATPKLATLAATILDDVPERTITIARDPTPEITLPIKRPAESSLEPGEFASPAFLKRARMSYGSLFEGGTDIFEADGGAKSKGRKRSKIARFSSSWRYASRSPTPESEGIGDEVEIDERMADNETETPSKPPPMVDGGCQTDELDFTPPHHVDVIAEPRIGLSQAFDTPSKSYSERQFQPSNVQSYATSRSGPTVSEDGDVDDDLDAGGDYDIAHYRNQSNVQDDDEASDFESDYGQEREGEIYNPGDSELEEDQLDQDIEDLEDEEYSEEEAPAPPSPPKPKGPPEVIDLLSDSDDDDDPGPPVQQPPVQPVSLPLPQYDGSADDMESPSGEEAEQSEASEDEAPSQASDVASEQADSEAESEAEDQSASEEVESSPLLVAVPEDRRETTDIPAESSPMLEDDLESMSPIRPLQVAGLMRDDEMIVSDDDTSDAAKIDTELENEMQQTIQEDPTPTLDARPSDILVVEETRLEIVETVVSGPDANAMDIAPESPPAVAAPGVQEGDVEMEDQPQPFTIPAVPSPDGANREEREEPKSSPEAAVAESLPFFSARAVLDHPDATQDTDGSKAHSGLPLPVSNQAFNPQADTSIAKTSGIDHSISRPLGREVQHVSPPTSSVPVSGDSPGLERPESPAHAADESEQEDVPLVIAETDINASESPESPEIQPSLSQPATTDENAETDLREDTVMEDEAEARPDLVEVDEPDTVMEDEAEATPDLVEVDEPDTVMEEETAQLPTPLDTQQQESTKEQLDEQAPKTNLSPAAPSIVVTSSVEDEQEAVEDKREDPTTPKLSTEEAVQSGKAESPVPSGHRPETRSQTGHLPSEAGQSSPGAQDPTGDAQVERDDPHTPIKEAGHRPETRSQSRPQSLEPGLSSPQASVVPDTTVKEAAVEETPATKTRSQRKRGPSRTKADGDDDGDSSVKLARASLASKQKPDSEDDPSVKLARASIASRRSTRLSDRQPTPDTVRVTRAACHNLQKSATPEAEEDSSLQLAKAALNSPSRTAKERAEEHSPTAIKLKLNRSLRSEVPDCISLKVLRQQPPGKTVDILAIATTEPPSAKRAKGGPKGMMLAFSIADHSIAATQPVLVHIFRVQKSALPIVHPGDAVLLRQFNVTNIQGKLGLRSTDASSWAVFEGEPDDERPPQIMGPPMELSTGDKSFAILIKKWYHSLEEAAKDKWNKAGEKALGAGEESK
ncbi:hypothetical protein ACHAQA_000724 [Verticillium albo-atrum]